MVVFVYTQRCKGASFCSYEMFLQYTDSLVFYLSYGASCPHVVYGKYQIFPYFFPKLYANTVMRKQVHDEQCASLLLSHQNFLEEKFA